MKEPTLTVAIFTYNRQSKLKQTIDYLLPQITDEIELLISDNNSTDGTRGYLESLGNKASVYLNTKNFGLDFNYINCLEKSKGKYVWTLCDDDIIRPNIIKLILVAINTHLDVPFIFLKPYGYENIYKDKFSSTDGLPDWKSLTAAQLLNEVGAWITFASSIVCLKSALDMDFIRSQEGDLLTPAAVALSTASKRNSALISKDVLVLSEEGEINRYDMFTVFSKNFFKLLKACKRFGYDNRTLYDAFGACLVTTLSGRISNWKLTKCSLFNLIFYGGRHHLFYFTILKPLTLRILKRIMIK